MFILVFAMIFALLRGFATEKIKGVSVGRSPGIDEL